MIDCRKVAQHLYEYIDREVDSKTAAEIEAHIKLCSPCFKEYDLEAKLKEFVCRKAAACPGTDELKSRILEELRKVANEPAERGKRIWLWTGGVAAAAALIFLFVFGLPHIGGGPDPMIVQAAAEHQNHLVATVPRLPEEISIDSVNSLLESQIGFDPEVVYFSHIWPQMRAFHAATWNGRSAACLYFAPEGEEGISLLICQDASRWMPRGKKVRRSGKEYVMASHNGCLMVFWTWEGMLCCAVGKESQEKLLNFTRSV